MKHVQLFEDFVNEGLFDFLKSDVIDFTKEEQPEEKKPRKRLRDIFKSDVEDFTGDKMDINKRRPKYPKPDITPSLQRPYYGAQEEEEEEAPYKKVVRRSDDYWSDENVRIREARKRKIRTTSDMGPK